MTGLQRTPNQEREYAKEKIKLVINFFLFLAVVAPVAQKCASAPAPPQRWRGVEGSVMSSPRAQVLELVENSEY